jgi:phage terminase Nu1 subunit (DNA packaging protein)
VGARGARGVATTRGLVNVRQEPCDPSGSGARASARVRMERKRTRQLKNLVKNGKLIKVNSRFYLGTEVLEIST